MSAHAIYLRIYPPSTKHKPCVQHCLNMIDNSSAKTRTPTGWELSTLACADLPTAAADTQIVICIVNRARRHRSWLVSNRLRQTMKTNSANRRYTGSSLPRLLLSYARSRTIYDPLSRMIFALLSTRYFRYAANGRVNQMEKAKWNFILFMCPGLMSTKISNAQRAAARCHPQCVPRSSNCTFIRLLDVRRTKVHSAPDSVRATATRSDIKRNHATSSSVCGEPACDGWWSQQPVNCFASTLFLLKNKTSLAAQQKLYNVWLRQVVHNKPTVYRRLIYLDSRHGERYVQLRPPSVGTDTNHDFRHNERVNGLQHTSEILAFQTYDVESTVNFFSPTKTLKKHQPSAGSR